MPRRCPRLCTASSRVVERQCQGRARLPIDPRRHARCPPLGGRGTFLVRGVFARGGRMRDKDSRKPLTLGGRSAVVPGLAVLAGQLWSVPGRSDLLALSALADAYRLLYEKELGIQNCTAAAAGKHVVNALLGDVPGIDAKGLKVFEVFASGPVELSSTDLQEGEIVFRSERWRRLRDLGLPLIYGQTLDSIPEARNLAVLKGPALAVFGLQPAAPQQSNQEPTSTPGPVHRSWPQHDWHRWGTASNGEGLALRRVADVVALRCNHQTSIERALQSVLAELRQALPTCAGWFMLQPGKDPDPLDESDIWEVSPPHFHDRPPGDYPEWQRTSPRTDKGWHFFVQEPNFPGFEGLFECLKSTMQHARSIPDLDSGLAGRIAVPESVASAVAKVLQSTPPTAIFREAPGVDQLQSAPSGERPTLAGDRRAGALKIVPKALRTVFHPAGGSWPHVPGEDWTDAKRVALFKMRHLSRMTDAELAKEAGIKAGQQISQLIGSRSGFKRWMNGEPLLPSNSWEPSAALLQECGLSPRNPTVKRG